MIIRKQMLAKMFTEPRETKWRFEQRKTNNSFGNCNHSANVFCESVAASDRTLVELGSDLLVKSVPFDCLPQNAAEINITTTTTMTVEKNFMINEYEYHQITKICQDSFFFFNIFYIFFSFFKCL